MLFVLYCIVTQQTVYLSYQHSKTTDHFRWLCANKVGSVVVRASD